MLVRCQTAEFPFDTHLLDKEYSRESTQEGHEPTHYSRQRVWEIMKEFDAAEDIRKLRRRIRPETT